MGLKLFLTVLIVLLLSSLMFEAQAQKRNKCPDYMWGIEYVAVTYLGFENSPAKILHLSYGDNEIEEKYRVGIGLENASGKAITEIKFQWYLFNMETLQNSKAENREMFLKNEVLMQDEISIKSKEEFKSKEKVEVEVKLPCEKISNKIYDIKITERVIMEFVVSEISYSDGSNWSRK